MAALLISGLQRKYFKKLLLLYQNTDINVRKVLMKFSLQEDESGVKKV